MREADLPVQVDEYNDFASLLKRYSAALTRLEDLGVRISAASRLRAYERRLQQVLDDPRPAVEGELVFALAFDLREIDEIIEVVDFLPVAPDPHVLRLLRQLQGGGDNPDREEATSAREAQYELYLGTVLRRGGITTTHGAPDLVANWAQRLHYIEAKRPSSALRVDDRLRSAVHQVRRLPRPGVIALSLDQVIRPPDTILSAPQLSSVAPEVERQVSRFVMANVAVWRRRLAGEPIDAMLLTARVPARLESTGHLVLGTNVQVEVLTAGSDVTDTAEFCWQAARAHMAAQGRRA